MALTGLRVASSPLTSNPSAAFVGELRRPVSALHITSEFPPLHFGGLGTALAGLVGAADGVGATLSILLVDPGVGGYESSEARYVAYTSYMSYGSYGYGGYGSHVWGESGRPLPTRALLVEALYQDAVSKGIRLVNERAHAVIHLHASWLWPIAEEIRAATGAPILYTLHSIDRVEIEAGEWIPHGDIQDAAIARADCLVVLSEGERKNLLRYYPNVRRIRVIGNGIECTGSPGDIHRTRDFNRVPRVLYVGRFANRKGTHDLIAALPLLLERHPRTEFVMVGGGTPHDSSRRAAEWLPVPLREDPRVRLIGWRTEVEEFYRGADILIVPSRYEPFGIVILEGMRAGIAIAATHTGGASEILQDGVTGLLFPPGDIRGLVDAVGSLIALRRVRRRLGRAAAAAVRRHWGWPGIYEKIDRAYRGMLDAADR
jgi:glycogen(starch) synthase